MININICADDYALTPKVSAGILELIDAARISATSVMTTSEYWPETSSALLKYKDKVDIGIHLTLTDLQPLTPMPQFAPRGVFPNIKTLIKLAYLKKLPVAEIRQELIEQLQRFYLYFGRWPNHIDGHHHMQILPGIREIVIELFSKFIGIDGYVRNCYASPWEIMQRRVACYKAASISALSWRFRQQLHQLSIPTNLSFAGAYEFDQQADIDYGQIFKRLLKGARDQLLIMVHPGYSDEILRAKDPLTAGREHELKFLQTPSFLELLQQHQIQLKPFTSKAA